MSKTYKLLADSFTEIINDYKNNDGKNLTHDKISIHINNVKQYSSSEIRHIRTSNNLTQSLLAKYIGVSKKTVEAWESGRNTPNGPSSRLLEMLEEKKIAFI